MNEDLARSNIQRRLEKSAWKLNLFTSLGIRFCLRFGHKNLSGNVLVSDLFHLTYEKDLFRSDEMRDISDGNDEQHQR